MTKTKTWRTYYGYRRPTYSEQGRLTDTQIRKQEKAYVAWLAKSRDLSKSEAETYARSQERGSLLSAITDHESNVRREEWVSPYCCIRTVRCFSAKAREEWNGEEWVRFKAGYSWRPSLPKSEAPTVYVVVVGGRHVDSFLSKARAKERALALAA